MYGQQAKSFENEITKRKHDRVGVVSMAEGNNSNRSQFFITLRQDDLSHLDEKHTIFGQVSEGLDVLEKINNLYCDGFKRNPMPLSVIHASNIYYIITLLSIPLALDDGRPFQDVRIRHTYILDDPYADPVQLDIPPGSPISSFPDEVSCELFLSYFISSLLRD
jgi:peptidyl-prolyl cis-trans isomerase-like 4